MGFSPVKEEPIPIGITLDYTKKEVSESLKGFQPLPKGNYPGIMTKYEEGVAESSGQPKVTVTYEIAPEAAEGAGRRIIKDYSLQPKALWRWTNDMVALGGIDADYFNGNNKVVVQQVCEANISRKCTLSLLEPDEGYNNNKLEKVRPRA